MRRCFMFGHSDCLPEVFSQIEMAVRKHYLQHNVRVFCVGNRGALGVPKMRTNVRSKHARDFDKFQMETPAAGQIRYTYDNGTVVYIYELTENYLQSAADSSPLSSYMAKDPAVKRRGPLHEDQFSVSKYFLYSFFICRRVFLLWFSLT